MPTQYESDTVQVELVKLHPVVVHSLVPTHSAQEEQSNLNLKTVINIERYGSKFRLLRNTELGLKLIVLLKDSKAYICLWTCTPTRAVHLKYVACKLSATAFLLALRHFCSQRGVSIVIFSNHAKTFKYCFKSDKGRTLHAFYILLTYFLYIATGIWIHLSD